MKLFFIRKALWVQIIKQKLKPLRRSLQQKKQYQFWLLNLFFYMLDCICISCWVCRLQRFFQILSLLISSWFFLLDKDYLLCIFIYTHGLHTCYILLFIFLSLFLSTLAKSLYFTRQLCCLAKLSLI